MHAYDIWVSDQFHCWYFTFYLHNSQQQNIKQDLSIMLKNSSNLGEEKLFTPGLIRVMQPVLMRGGIHRQFMVKI